MTPAEGTRPPPEHVGMPGYYLHPGGLYLTQEPTAVKTILGSCVSVCLWDIERKYGGLNHFMLPEGHGHGPDAYRFGSVAIVALIHRMTALGTLPQNLRAKVFGGATMSPYLATSELAQRNVDMAFSVLKEWRIQVVGGDHGGDRGRRLVFHTGDGSASVWRLLQSPIGPGEQETIVEIDRELLMQAFAAEAEEQLEALEQTLLDVEQRPGDPESVRTLFRLAHTLKGNASIVGLDRVTQIAHVTEDVLDGLRKQRFQITTELVTVLLGTVDIIRQLLPMALSGASTVPAKFDETLERLAQLSRHDSISRTGASPEEEAQAVEVLRDVRRRALRVDVEKLDRMLDLVGELAIARGRLNRSLADVGSTDLTKVRAIHDESESLFSDLQEMVLKLRTVPLGPLFRQLARTVRDLSGVLGKPAHLESAGEDLEIDTSILEGVRDPLTHLVRNALDHGLETAEERQALGKNPQGCLRLSARREGASLQIVVTDDGAGLDRERILARARERGFAGEESLSDEQIFRLIMEPGFSTAQTVTEVSGRGVGMDIVRRNIENLRGTVSISSRKGEGTTITLHLPLTLTILPAFFVGVEGQTYALALEGVVECLHLPDEAVTRKDGCGVLSLRGQAVPYFRLRHLFSLGGTPAGRERVVVVQRGERRAGLVVDELHGEGNAVMKPLGPLFHGLEPLSGSTIWGDGRVALILDTDALLKRVHNL